MSKNLETRKFHVTYVVSPSRIVTAEKIVTEFTKRYPSEFVPVKSIADMFTLLGNPHFATDAFVIDIDHIYSDKNVGAYSLLEALYTLIESTVFRSGIGARSSHRKPRIWVMAGLSTPPDQIKEMSKLPFVYGVSLMLGNNVTMEDMMHSGKLIVDDVPGVHPRLIELIRTKKKIKPADNPCDLTVRQAQILKLVCDRGASNKVIAKTLNISESTVKLHITGLLKKYGCRNRTQLAVYSKIDSTTCCTDSTTPAGRWSVVETSDLYYYID